MFPQGISCALAGARTLSWIIHLPSVFIYHINNHTVGVNGYKWHLSSEGSKCFDVHQGVNALHNLLTNGLADVPPHIFYFGSFSSYIQCEEACRQVRKSSHRVIHFTILRQVNKFFVFQTTIMNIVRNKEIISFLSSQSANTDLMNSVIVKTGHVSRNWR